MGQIVAFMVAKAALPEPDDLFSNPIFWLFGGLFLVIGIAREIEEPSPCGLFFRRVGCRIGRFIWRAALGLALIPLVFLAWYILAAIPVSIAIIIGACIIFCGIRSLPGRARRVMEHHPAEQQLPRRSDSSEVW